MRNSIKIKEQSPYNLKEQWKYTNINNFRKIGTKQRLLSLIKEKNTKNITITNSELIQNNLTNTDILLENINSSINNNASICKKFFNKIMPSNNNEFITQNTRNFKSGIHIHIKDNTKILEPIFIENITKTNDEKKFLNCRYLFTFGKNVSAKIIFNDTNSSKNYLNTAIEIFVDTNSKIDFIIDSEKPKTTEIINLASIIRNDSTLNSYHLNLSGKLFKNNYFINLLEQNSTFNYNGINLLDSDNHVDNYIEINHLNKYTISKTNQKNILKGNSKGVFYTKAIINKKGANSEAYQNNNNILLSSNANVYSNPQLEIYNDDVKCSHGSTTGAIDLDSLFYLRSRGINLKEAKKILLNGFLNEIITPIDIISYNNKINKKINNWLYNVN